MEYYHNPGKALEIEVAGERYLRHGIRTHFVEVGEDYLDLFRRYVVPVYRPGDWVAVSEKVARLCQGRVIHRQEIQVTWLARLLAKCVRQTPAGPAWDCRSRCSLPWTRRDGPGFCGRPCGRG